MQNTPLFTIAAVVFLPMVPAYILFKFLPASAEVSGPFSGLNLKLTGAFGGYFIVLLAVMSFFHSLGDFEIWTVNGQVIAPGVNGSQLRISPAPDTSHDTNLAFKRYVVVTHDPDHRPNPPAILIEHPDYLTTTVSLLNPQGCTVTRKETNVTIKGDCLKLTKISDQPVYQTSLSN